MLVTHSFPFSSLCLRLKDGAFYFAPISKWSAFNSMHFAFKGILSHVIPYSENTKSDVIFGLPHILEYKLINFGQTLVNILKVRLVQGTLFSTIQYTRKYSLYASKSTLRLIRGSTNTVITING